MTIRAALVVIIGVFFSSAALADELSDLRHQSDQWWGLWTAAGGVDLDLAFEIEGGGAGFGYFGADIQRIEDKARWKESMRAWLNTLQSLEYQPSRRTFTIVGDTGLEWGHYHERQVRMTGEVSREITGRYSFTWAKTFQGWKIVSYHRSAMPIHAPPDETRTP